MSFIYVSPVVDFCLVRVSWSKTLFRAMFVTFTLELHEIKPACEFYQCDWNNCCIRSFRWRWDYRAYSLSSHKYMTINYCSFPSLAQNISDCIFTKRMDQPQWQIVTFQLICTFFCRHTLKFVCPYSLLSVSVTPYIPPNPASFLNCFF